MAELAVTAGLADETPDALSGAADGFAVGDAGLADVALNLEFAFHPVNQDFKVKFAHAGHNGLAGFVVVVDLECGVFVGELDERV